MAKYNLLDDDDIFDEKEESSTDENEITTERKTSESNIDMTEDIDINIDDSDDLLSVHSILHVLGRQSCRGHDKVEDSVQQQIDFHFLFFYSTSYR